MTALAGQRDVRLLLPPLQNVQFEVLDAYTRKTTPGFEVLLTNESGMLHLEGEHVFKLQNSIRVFEHALIKKDGYQILEIDLVNRFPLNGSRNTRPQFELFPGRKIVFAFSEHTGTPREGRLRMRWENPPIGRVWHSQIDARQEPPREGDPNPTVEIVYANGSYESMSFQAYEGEYPGTPVGPRILIPAGQTDIRREILLE